MTTYSLNQSGDDIRRLQRALNEIQHLDLRVSGHLDRVTQSALQDYQRAHRCVEKDRYGAVYGEVSQEALREYIEDRFLTNGSVDRVAQGLLIDPAVLWAVVDVFSEGIGFHSNGSIITTFERHLFYSSIVNKLSKREADQLALKRPDICASSPGGYVGGKHELVRLNDARGYYNEEAIESGLFGLFSLPGAKYKACGHLNAMSLFEAINTSEEAQLKAFCMYMTTNSALHEALVRKDWTGFARRYYGASCESGNFGARLGNAYLTRKSMH
jgi:N-acetylmuramidase